MRAQEWMYVKLWIVIRSLTPCFGVQFIVFKWDTLRGSCLLPRTLAVFLQNGSHCVDFDHDIDHPCLQQYFLECFVCCYFGAIFVSHGFEGTWFGFALHAAKCIQAFACVKDCAFRHQWLQQCPCDFEDALTRFCHFPQILLAMLPSTKTIWGKRTKITKPTSLTRYDGTMVTKINWRSSRPVDAWTWVTPQDRTSKIDIEWSCVIQMLGGSQSLFPVNCFWWSRREYFRESVKVSKEKVCRAFLVAIVSFNASFRDLKSSGKLAEGRNQADLETLRSEHTILKRSLATLMTLYEAGTDGRALRKIACNALAIANKRTMIIVPENIQRTSPGVQSLVLIPGFGMQHSLDRNVVLGPLKLQAGCTSYPIRELKSCLACLWYLWVDQKGLAMWTIDNAVHICRYTCRDDTCVFVRLCLRGTHQTTRRLQSSFFYES